MTFRAAMPFTTAGRTAPSAPGRDSWRGGRLPSSSMHAPHRKVPQRTQEATAAASRVIRAARASGLGRENSPPPGTGAAPRLQ